MTWICKCDKCGCSNFHYSEGKAVVLACNNCGHFLAEHLKITKDAE